MVGIVTDETTIQSLLLQFSVSRENLHIYGVDPNQLRPKEDEDELQVDLIVAQ